VDSRASKVLDYSSREKFQTFIHGVFRLHVFLKLFTSCLAASLVKLMSGLDENIIIIVSRHHCSILMGIG
jgi:hypothetical protein